MYAKVHWTWIPKSCLTVPILYLKCLPYDQLYFICLTCAGWDTKQTSFENSNAAPEYAKKLECHASTLDSSIEPCLPKVCNFYVKNFVCSCRWRKLVNFSRDKYVCWKVGTLGFMWQIGVVTWKIVCVDNLYIKWQICLLGTYTLLHTLFFSHDKKKISLCWPADSKFCYSRRVTQQTLI